MHLAPQPRFTAVVTTGIYCRPECGASPKPENTRPFAFAAAAEAAGFRPCLRCRPYRVSEPAAWVGGSELVCRAVRLILDGALDETGEEELAERLGVSARHLRRLFHDHVGATPDAVARSRRAHFARRLLDDTDLPIVDVCFAAGFGSVRQMNRVMQEVFRASPKELRARRRRTDRLVADGGLDLRLPFRPPLDWDGMLAFLAPRAIPGVEEVVDGVYRRTVAIEGWPGVLEVSRGGDDHLVLRAHLPRWEGLIHVVERVRRLFDLDVDPAAVQAHLSGDPLLGPLVATRPGLRMPGAWDPFEVSVRAILGQQVSVAGATTLTGRLVERFGVPVTGLSPLGLTHLFPEPAALADADPTSIGLPGARAAAISALARAVLDAEVVLDGSRSLTDTVSALTALPGIGPWTAQYVAMRACSEADAFPAGDLGIRRALGDVSEKEVRERAEGWRPWRAYAAAQLWASNSTGSVSGPRKAKPKMEG